VDREALSEKHEQWQDNARRLQDRKFGEVALPVKATHPYQDPAPENKILESLSSPDLKRKVAERLKGLMSPTRKQSRLAKKKAALEEELREHLIFKPHRVTTSKREALYFNPPLEARNPELVIHKHIAKVGVKDVLKEKHVPFRKYLEDMSELKSQRAKSVTASTCSKSIESKSTVAFGLSTHGKQDFNMYEKMTQKKRLEIMELKRRSNMINDRIR
jgi:hypothetical protein